MSIKENKALVRRAYALSTLKDMEAFFEFLAPDYVEHFPTGDLTLKQLKKGIPEFFNAFPDIHLTIEDMVAEGDKVAVLMTQRGTHKGEYMGIPPTGNRIEMRNTCIVRIANGKLVEWWGTLDGLSMMRQLGVVPKK